MIAADAIASLLGSGSSLRFAGARVTPRTALYPLAFICILIGFKLNGHNIQLLGFALLLPASLVAWLANHRRYRIVGDTPTAPIRSAAQGYVELIGRCELLPGAFPLMFKTLPPSAWYRVTITEHDSRGSRSNTYTRQSDDTFLLVDATGECVVDPDDAEVLAVHTRRWRDGDTSYHALYLQPGDDLYALGDLETLRAADGVQCDRSQLSALLKEWKQAKPQLLQRFDRDGNGEIDLAEWQDVVSAAKKELHNQEIELAARPGIHLLKRPSDGRPFLLSSKDPERLMRRYKWWSLIHLIAFLASLALLARFFTLA